MCGRYTLRSPARLILDTLRLEAELATLPARYNIAPSQQVLAVRLQDTKRVGSFLRWGLIPPWATYPAIGNKMINARAESVASKPSYRSAFNRRRCLIVADGFYEWKKIEKAKQPYFIRLKDERPFAFAGLAEHWHRGEQTIDSCTIITTEPNELMVDFHDRMSVILSPDDYDLWLDSEFEGKEKLLSQLRPYPAELMMAYQVSTLVNSPRNESAECVEPVSLA
jgi:putative SOS response-associated peptidase YedK